MSADEQSNTTPADDGDAGAEHVPQLEPAGATRSSPSAIVAFVLSLFGLWRVATSTRFFEESWWQLVASEVVRAGVPIVIGVVSLTFAARVLDEIDRGDGAVGGVAFARAARVVAVLTIAAAIVGLAVDLLTHPSIRDIVVNG